MHKRLSSLITHFVLVLSLALNWVSLVSLKEAGTLFHVVANAKEADHSHAHHPLTKTEKHKHRHSPSEPEHEHAPVDLGLLTTFSLGNFVIDKAVFQFLKLDPSLEAFYLLDEKIPSSWIPLSNFRPPIG